MTKLGIALAGLALALAACGRPSPPRAASPQVRDILEVEGAEAFSASPDGRLWICAYDGQIYVSSDWNETWSEVFVPKHGTEDGQFLWYFDAKHALMPDYSEDGQTAAILRTEDDGRTWSSVAIPVAGRISDGQLEPSGRAWLASQSGAVFGSKDFGQTWRATAMPFESKAGTASVFFRTREEGYAGSYSNGLKRTMDGGQTWASLVTPADELCPPNPEATEEDHESEPMKGKDGKSVWMSFSGAEDSMVAALWVVGDQLLVKQGEQVFRAPLSAVGGWKLLEVEGQRVVKAIPTDEGLAVVTEDQRCAQLSNDLQQVLQITGPVPDRPLALATCKRGLAMLTDSRGKVCTWTAGRLECSRLYATGLNRAWRIESFDRTADGTLYGVTSSALYCSHDSGKTWELLAEGKQLSSIDARSDGTSVLVQDEDVWCVWSKAQPHLLALAGDNRPPPEASVVARSGSLWIATGFEAAKDKETQRMLRSSDTVLVGDGFTAEVLASADNGRAWKSIDRYPGAIVHASWLGKDNTLSLCMSDGTIRRGTIDPATGLVRGDGMHQVSADGDYLGGQWASWIVFPEPEIGWTGGYHYFGGIDTHHSEDGGKTWKAAETVEDRYMETFLLGGGGCVRMAGASSQPSRLDIWRNGKFELLCNLEYGPHDAHVDSTGALLVRLDNGDVWSLDKDGRDWKKIGNIDFPGR